MMWNNQSISTLEDTVADNSPDTNTQPTALPAPNPAPVPPAPPAAPSKGPTYSHPNPWRKAIDLRLLLVAFILVIGGVAGGMWKYYGGTNKDRTVKVTGEATVTSEPDEFIFRPYYTVTNKDRTAALRELASKSSSITSGLKLAGVGDSQIKSNSAGGNNSSDSRGSSGSTEPAIAPAPPDDKPNNDNTYSLQFVITVNNKSTAQKVQDYLNTTDPVSVVSPTSGFSDAKRKQLEAKARDDATKDARGKADQSAQNLGFNLGAVKTVADGTGFSDSPFARPAVMDAESSNGNATATNDLLIQAGSQTLRYSVSVEYYVR